MRLYKLGFNDTFVDAADGNIDSDGGWHELAFALHGLLLQPYVMRRTAKVRIWASIVAPIVLGMLWPFWGVVVAAPLLALLYVYKAQYQKRP